MRTFSFPGAEPARTVDGMFRSAASEHPHRDYLRLADGTRHTFADVARQVDALAEQLAAHGLARGDRVIFFLHTPLPSILFNLACAHLGVVPVPLSPSFSERALEQLVARVQAKAVLVDPQHDAVPALEVPLLALHPAAGVIALDPTPRRSFDDALRRLATVATHDPGSCYLFQPTSGTTGEPKLIMRSHAVFDRVARVHARDLPDGEHRMFLVAALTHGMGQYTLATSLHMAGTLCIPSQIDTASSLAELRAFDPTLLWATPRVLRSWQAQAATLDDGEARWFGPSARLLFIGGAATQPETLRAVAAQGVEVSEGYGASEISLLSQTRPGRWREGTSGEVLEDVELRHGDDGELYARSPGRMIGYHDDDALTAAAFTDDGFYRTGDYATVESGYLHYQGRKRDVFNTSEGANVHPGRIEALLEALPGVRQAVLVGDDRPYIAALLVASADEATLAQSIDRLNAGLEPMERIRRFAILEEPFDESMYRVVGHAKVSRNRLLLAARYEAQIRRLYDKPSTEAL